MNQKIAHWAQVIGNFGIVASLVFVGLQINQDRELKRIELMWASFDRVRDQHLHMLGENPQVTATKAAIRPDELTEEDLMILHNWYRADLFRVSQVALMVEQGIFPKSFFDGFTETNLFETKHGQQWLASRAIDTHRLPEDHVAGIRKRRDNPNGTQEWIHAWKEIK